MEQVKLSNSAASKSGFKKTKGKTNMSSGVDTPVTNTNWNPTLKKHWEASGFLVLNDMLKGKLLEVELPKFGNDTACLSWLIKGRCHSTCICANSHKQARATMIKNMHKLMDACGVPASN